MMTIVNAASKENVEPRYYVLDVDTMDANVVIGLNGISLLFNDKDKGLVTTMTINSWLMPGTNYLTIEITALSDGKKAIPSIDVKLYLHDSTKEIPTVKKLFASYQSSVVVEKEGEIKLPISHSVKFNFEDNIPTRLWREAQSIQMVSDKDKQEIISLANKLGGSILGGKIDAAIQLQEYKIIDDSISESKQVEEIRDAVRFNYEWLVKQPNLTAQPLTIEAAKFQMCCNNKLVYLTRKDGKAAVILESNDAFFDVVIYVAKIKGKWQIVR